METHRINVHRRLSYESSLILGRPSVEMDAERESQKWSAPPTSHTFQVLQATQDVCWFHQRGLRIQLQEIEKPNNITPIDPRIATICSTAQTKSCSKPDFLHRRGETNCTEFN